ncbi:class I SAM-dependent methyltransferase [Candidatus Microgenomates bacterium]|nr:class I SAM-dependent methyltransferase [Candidatus Microgenomates bacterium]
MSLERQTIEYYDREAENWVATHGGPEGESYWKEELDRFNGLLASGKILEIGSGAGKEAELFLLQGYDYTGIDASESLLNIARKRNPQAKLIYKRVEELDFPDSSFDGFWAAASLLHIPKSQIREVLVNLRRQIKLGGVGFISLKEGDGEEIEMETGRHFSYYQPDEFRDFLKGSGWEVIEAKVRPRGNDTTWLIFYIRT